MTPFNPMARLNFLKNVTLTKLRPCCQIPFLDSFTTMPKVPLFVTRVPHHLLHIILKMKSYSSNVPHNMITLDWMQKKLRPQYMMRLMTLATNASGDGWTLVGVSGSSASCDERGVSSAAMALIQFSF